MNIGIRRSTKNFIGITVILMFVYSKTGVERNEETWNSLVLQQLKVDIISKLKGQLTTSNVEIKPSIIKDWEWSLD